MNRFFQIPILLITALMVVTGGCGRKAESGKAGEGSKADRFKELMNAGKNYYEKGDTGKAIAAFSQALPLNPGHPDAHLNLANAYLLAGDATNALAEAQQTISLDHASAAAHYVAGCALMRLAQFEPGLHEFQTAKDIDPSVAAVSFQLGLAHFQLKHWEEAVQEFQAAIELEPEHPAAHYNLSQALIRSNQNAAAAKELEKHQQIAAKLKAGPPNAATYERSKFTEARTPFELEQPVREGVQVTFSDQTAEAFGGAADRFAGPIGVIDINQRGTNDLFVLEKGEKGLGFRLLMNSNGVFTATGQTVPGQAGARYYKTLVADLQNDRFEDVIVLGDKGSHVFRFATNGTFTDMSTFSRLGGLAAIDGAFVDLDFTGKLDLIALTAQTNGVKVFRNLGNFYFQDITATSGVPTGASIATQMRVADWNNDDLNDLFLAREGQPVQLLEKLRGGILQGTNSLAKVAGGTAMAEGDLNNDGKLDLVTAGKAGLQIIFNGSGTNLNIAAPDAAVTQIELVDFDNDGWLDICTVGAQVRLWRNLGASGFEERTKAVGLDKVTAGSVGSLAFADFDQDGDSDFIFARKEGGLQFWRNDGGNKNQLLKLKLLGNRSNGSGIGVKIEVAAGGLRLVRTVEKLPVEIGVGQHGQLDSCTVRWFDLSIPNVDLKVEKAPIGLVEYSLPNGSCPYLYAWDGHRFRFVTDLLGAAPIGLPVAEKRYIEADPQEYVQIGNDSNFQPRNGAYTLQITEELREVLYLDEAKLVGAYHPAGTEVHPTGKLVPGKPFPKAGLWTLGMRKPLLRAENHAGSDITAALMEADGKMASPTKLREPQLRGYAEPHAIILDFGALETEKSLVLALTGWLRFGGGMANIAASHRSELPFPFPTMEVEVDGKWQPVNIVVGAPAGKTKTILVDLAGKLPKGSGRLKIQAAFEIHWDRAAMFEHVSEGNTRLVEVRPAKTDLHFRGYSEFANLPWSQPLTPVYEQVRNFPYWRITPAGYCTRYGEVNALVAKRDEALVLINGGDELTLEFDAAPLAAARQGEVRDFFLYSDGWDKDSDFHVARGWTVEPWPHHGMDDQQPELDRPSFPSDPLMQRYTTRWVAPETFPKTVAQKAD